MVHAENVDVINYLTEKALEEGNTDPINHALTRPSELEGEATGRAAKLTALADSKLYVVHVNCEDEVVHIVDERSKGLRVLGENYHHTHIFDSYYINILVSDKT